MMKQLWETETGPERKALGIEHGLCEGDVCFQKDVKSHFICVSTEPLRWIPFHGELAAYKSVSEAAVAKGVCGYCGGKGGGYFGPACPRCGETR